MLLSPAPCISRTRFLATDFHHRRETKVRRRLHTLMCASVYVHDRVNVLAKVARGEFNWNSREGTARVTVVSVTLGYTQALPLARWQRRVTARSPEVKVTSSLIWSPEHSDVVKRQHNVSRAIYVLIIVIVLPILSSSIDLMIKRTKSYLFHFLFAMNVTLLISARNRIYDHYKWKKKIGACKSDLTEYIWVSR